MSSRLPLVIIAGQVTQFPAGDTLDPAVFTASTPAPVSSGGGTNALTAYVVTASAGGNTTDTAAQTGGTGTGLTFAGGKGGTADSATSGAPVGGTGGPVSLKGGPGADMAAAGSTNATGGVGASGIVGGGDGGAASGPTSGNNTGGDGDIGSVAGGQGGAASNAAGTNAGGTGAQARTVGGNGGTATGGVNAFGGLGGDAVVQSGNGGNASGGSGSNVGGNAGNVVLRPGNHGSGSGTGASSGTYGTSGFRNPASTRVAKLAGALFDHFADAQNTTTGETTLYTDTIPANQLLRTGDKLTAVYTGTTVAHATATRRLRVYFAGTVIYDSTAQITAAANPWLLRVELYMDTTTSIRVVVSMINLGALAGWPTLQLSKLTGLTLTSSTILKITGQAGATGAATGDIVAQQGAVSYGQGF